MNEKPLVRVVSAEIQREGRYLLVQRPEKAVLPLLWEFPGGRVRDDEQEHEALTRAVRARLGVDLRVGERLMEVRHAYPAYEVVLAVYRCDLGDEEPSPVDVAAIAWVEPAHFADYPFPGADQATVDALLGIKGS
ncbi:MAG: (deoxy)nucleoside triphosphate pyrophosphohydrolase [Deltaproteobacteria bacterium]|nr:(deoxy)nucleoside triphosphate pyrophosphohydrolase [Deltaproteobacteria bacterium]